MKLSHSKLSTILSCPMTYYLCYIQGIYKLVEKPALAIGSAVHWGIEHDSEDLTEYFKTHGSFKNRDAYTRDQHLAEAMVHGYLKHKDEIFEQILTCPKTGEKLTLLEETHELYVTGKLKSYLKGLEYHDFVGIVDLLLLTDKGFIILDYKTSSQTPNWDDYLEQLYRYIMLIQTTFPEIPICKICIVNIRKTGIRQKKNETDFQFMQRMRFEYELNDENYVNYHEYDPSAFDERLVGEYIKNLGKMCDLAHMIDENKTFFINYANAVGQYGKSEYWDIFYHTPDAHVLYGISDKVWSDEEKQIVTYRNCVPLDMQVIEHNNCLNKYALFKSQIPLNFNSLNKDRLFEELRAKFRTDDYLLELYWTTFIKELNSSQKGG